MKTTNVNRPARPNLSLTLADGTAWLIRAGDPEAARVVASLGAAMQLRPGIGGRELLVTVSRGKAPPANLAGLGPVVCTLPPLLSEDLLTIGMAQLGLAIARESQSRGGVLVHGALAEHSGLGHGILLAGPGAVGKTSASNRLPPPWRARCDDTALVVRDGDGRYWAHPWPTWSRFYTVDGAPGPGGSWDVQRGVPLRSIFFLSQSPEDRVEPLPATPATAMLMDAVQHVSRAMTRGLDPVEARALHLEQLAAVQALAREVTTCTLYLSLAGAFWEEMELGLQDLPDTRVTGHVSRVMCQVSRVTPSIESLVGDGARYIAYTGPSMNPTLAEPDLLEVRPYEDRSIRPGDVVYYQSPRSEHLVAHRVVQVTPDGIRTRGDNNSTDDPCRLRPSDVLGQVVSAQRGLRRRRIAGGRRGMLERYRVWLWRMANWGASRLLHRAYRALSGDGRFRRLLPTSWQPRLFVFQARHRTFLKLLMGRGVIGQYDTREEHWRIRRPFRLFVDAAALPCPSVHTEPLSCSPATGRTEPASQTAARRCPDARPTPHDCRAP